MAPKLGGVQVFCKRLWAHVLSRLLGGKDEVGARVRGEPLFCVNERLHEGRDRHAMSSAFFHLDGWDSEHVRLDPRLAKLCIFARSQHRAE